MSGAKFKGITDIQNMSNNLKNSFDGLLRLDSNGISQYTMEQIRAKSAVLGLTDSLTIQAVAMAKDADFSAKAATGTLTFGKALDKGIGSTDELVQALKESGKLTKDNIDEISKAAIIGGEAYRTTVSSIISENDEIKNSTIKIGASASQSTGFINSFKQSFKGLYATLKPMLPLIVTIGTAFAAYKGFKFLDDKFTLTFGTAQKHLEDSSSAYAATVSELENLNSQTDQYKSTLESIGNNYDIKFSGSETVDEMIEKLRLIDGKKINLTDESTINKLERENDLLETRKNLLTTTADSQQRKAAEDARKSINFASEEISFKKTNGEAANHRNDGSDVKYKVDRKRYVQELVGEMERAQQQIDEAQDKLNDKSTSKADKKTYKKQFEQATENLEKYKNEATEIATKLSEESKSFYDEQTGLVIDGFEDDAKAVKDVIDMVTNFDLSPEEKDLSTLDSFFSSTAGNAIGDYLNNIVAESGNAEDALRKFKELGLSLDDIGVSQDNFIKYFQDVAKSAQQAKDKASSVGTTLSDVDAAFKSENKDADWKKFADYATQARDLAKQDKWGTDDLQKSIEWVLPKFNVKKELKKNDDLEYVADVYEKKYKDAEKLYKRYFDAENPKTSAANFQNDLIDKGLLKEDKTGLTGTFDNTAEAAEKMKMSLEATETLLHNLESYGFEWDDVTFSGENITRYENTLNNIKSLRDSMGEGAGKERLDGLISNWDEEYAKYQDDLSSLSEEQIVHIEFEYSMAQIQSEIDQLQRLANEGDNTQKAALNAKKSEYRDKREKETGYDESISKGYANASQKVKDLQSKFGDVKDENARAKIQDQISAIYDLQNAFQDAYSDNKAVDWDSFLKSKEADKAFEAIKESTGLAKEDIVDILDIDPKDIEINAKVNDEVTSAFESMISISTGIPKEIITELLAEDKASDATIKVLSEISGIPEEKITEINASDGASGVLATVLSQITGIPKSKITKFLASDDVSGLAKKVVKETKKVPKKTKTNMTATDGVTPKANSAKNALAGVKDKKITISATVSDTVSNAVNKVKNALGSVNASANFGKKGGVTKLNGTAHKEGTAKDKITTTTLPLSQKEVSEKTGGLHPIPKLSRRALAHGTLDDETWLNPNWKTKKSEDALTGELGQEIVVYGNRWWTVGDNGAEFSHIPAGSVVFNAKQTKELLKNGFTPSRGAARLSGTAHLEGTAYASRNGGRKLSSSSSTKKKTTTTTSSSTSKGKGKGKSKKNTKKTKETFDWIEVAINRIERAIDALDLKASSVYKAWSDRNKSLKSELSKVNKEITIQQKGFKRYKQEAAKVSKTALKKAKDDGYKKSTWKSLTKKVREGKIDISTIKNEKLANRIKEYQQW